MTQGISPGETAVVAFCCVDHLSGGTLAVTGSDARLDVPTPGIYAFAGVITYGGGSGEGAVVVTVEVSNSAGAPVWRPFYGLSTAAWGSVSISAHGVLAEGDQVRVYVQNGSSNGITLENTSHLDVAFISGPTERLVCGNGEGPDPIVPDEPTEWGISTDGLGCSEATEVRNTVHYVVTEDSVITHLIISGRSEQNPHIPEFPVLNLFVDGVKVGSLDTGDILPDEYPRSQEINIPVFVGDEIWFQSEGRGCVQGSCVLVGGFPETGDGTLEWGELEPEP